MDWNDLSMSEKAAVITLAVKNGIYSRQDIIDYFTQYNDWKEQMAQSRDMNVVDMDNDPTYNYGVYYASDPREAWNMINSPKDAHYTDVGKTNFHPTNSDESWISDPNWQGKWYDDYNYELSPNRAADPTLVDQTLDYIGANNRNSVNVLYPDGSYALPEVTVTPEEAYMNLRRNISDNGWVYSDRNNKYVTGGHKETIPLRAADRTTLSKTNKVAPIVTGGMVGTNLLLNDNGTGDVYNKFDLGGFADSFGTEQNPILLPELVVTPAELEIDYNNKFGFGGTLRLALNSAKKLTSNIKSTIENELTIPNIYKTIRGWFEDEPSKPVSNFSPIKLFSDLDLDNAFLRLSPKYIDKSLNLAKSALNSMSKDEIKNILRSLAEQGFYDKSLEGKTKKLIKDILRQLVNKGYLDDRKTKNGKYAEVDGIVGNKTIIAYNLYNRDKNIDGIVGKKTETGYLLSLGMLEGNVSKVSAKGVDGCALWVTKLFESMYGGKSKLNGVISNAWLMIKNIENKGGELIYNIYDNDFNKIKDVKALKSLTEKKLKQNPLDYSQVHLGDIVGIYMPSSNMHKTALKEGTTKNTHVGIVTGFNEDGVPIISHNIHESLRDDLITNISGSKNGKAKVTSIARPKNATSITRQLPFTNKDSSVYIEGVKDKNGVLGLYMNSIEGSKEIIGLIFPSVNMDFVLKIALGIQLRETGMLLNRTSDLIKRSDSSLINVPKLKDSIRNYARYVKGLDEESKSSDTGKMKLSAFTPSERVMLGIKTLQDLNDPVIAGRAAMYYLSKNADYFIRLRKEYPELGLTDNDIAGLTALSYNLGMGKLKHIGFNADTKEVDMSEIDSIRLMQNPNYRVKDVNSTNWRYLGPLGEWIYNETSEGSESYMSSALRNAKKVKKKNK